MKAKPGTPQSVRLSEWLGRADVTLQSEETWWRSTPAASAWRWKPEAAPKLPGGGLWRTDSGRMWRDVDGEAVGLRV